MSATLTDSKATSIATDRANDLLQFFDERGGLPGNSLDEQLDLPLFEAGVISSVGLVELVMHLEQRYNIELDPEELQGPDFQTCRGIIRIIERRISA
ncbi:acyl carrier protein [bacterium]|nr:acyl carrier protein [bacterium]